MTMNERMDGPASGWAIVALRACGMSPKDIGALLGADDPEIVRRRIALHVERLEERLARQRRILGRVERRLRESAPRRRPVAVYPSAPRTSESSAIRVTTPLKASNQ